MRLIWIQTLPAGKYIKDGSLKCFEMEQKKTRFSNEGNFKQCNIIYIKCARIHKNIMEAVKFLKYYTFFMGEYNLIYER